MSEERNFEEEAREQGWIDQGEYQEKHGHTKGWKEAQAFVEAGETILPIVNAKNKELRGEVEQLKAQVAEITKTSTEFKNFTVEQQKKAKAERESLRQQLKEAQAKAVGDGDSEAFQKAQTQLDKLESSEVGEQQSSQPDAAALESAKKWEQANAWYKGTSVEDRVRTAAVDGAANQVAEEKPWLVGKGAEFYEACVEKAQEMFPESFGKSNGESKVETGGQKNRANSKAKTFENLPQDAKQAYQRFKKTMPDFTEEEYLATYEWES